MVVYVVFFMLFMMVVLSLMATVWVFSGMSVMVYVMMMEVSWGMVKVGVVLDEISVVVSMVVLVVSMMVMVFSAYYMVDDGSLSYFVVVVCVFVFGMLVLVLSGSFLVSYVGWDILGVVSFMLIMYYGNYTSVGGSLVTMLMNRVGDCLLIIAFVWVLMVDQEWWAVGKVNSVGMACLSLLVIMAAVTKSAQFPYSVWLPLAMAAPTPVSALVHSSTLVTAGVYLMIRWNGVMGQWGAGALLVMSMVTVLYSGLMLVSEEDFKKVVALSTLMHLGIMMGMVSLGGWYSGYVHLVLHAVYKSLLFIGVGVVIVNMSHDQVFGSMSSVCKFLSFNSSLVMVSVLSLSGLPFFSGFYTKEIIVGLMLGSSMSMVLVGVGLAGLSVSVLYSLRLLWVFVGGGPSKSLVVVRNGLVRMMGPSFSAYGVMSVVVGWVCVQMMSVGIYEVPMEEVEVVMFYVVMLVVVAFFWGVKFSYLLVGGYWVGVFTSLMVSGAMKGLEVISEFDVVWVEYVYGELCPSVVHGASVVTWVTLVKGVLVYIISFTFLVFIIVA
uniref:NADH-ubiquinone oxidoreductase chain 5 n=1 Tax=Oncicola luehei TaxID=1100885 RepID=H2E2E0_9BILA|nr:NADH dehydrogenase subunit 5 [Oncicola luehei]AER42899.1 NADH dehydrogenase subunit 5 [Oncicola luehei]